MATNIPPTYAYDIHTDTAGRARWRDVLLYKFFTSRLLVFLFITLLLTGGAMYALQAVYALPDVSMDGLSLLLVSAAFGLFATFLFGSTFFPYRRLSLQPHELLSKSENKNVVLASSFELLMVIGKDIRRGDENPIVNVADSLFGTPVARLVMSRLEISMESCMQVMKTTVIPAMSWSSFAEAALSIAMQADAKEVGVIHALSVFLLHPKFQPYIRQQKLQEKDIWFMIWYVDALRTVEKAKHRWWSREALTGFSGIGLSWAAGLTPFVDRFARVPEGNLWDTAYAREQEVDLLITSLARKQENNVLLVGHPGVGRLGVVKELARKIRLQKAHPELNHERVVYIHVGELLSLGSNSTQQLQTVSRVLHEMERAGNIIAVLDGVSSILGGGKETTLNLTDVLTPFFSSKAVRVVVIMSSDEYHMRIESNDELMHLFDVVQVNPLSEDSTLQLLALSLPFWEEQTGVFIPYKTIREVIQDTEHIMPSVPYPEKAFDVIEEALSKAQNEELYVIDMHNIQELIANRIGVEVGVLGVGEDQKLLSLEESIHKRVINQEKGVAAVARAMIRARAGVRSMNRPIGSFLFLGPSGVGKTETAKALAESYFGAEGYLQRLDMSEYQTEDGLTRLIGTLDHPVGVLTKMIADQPFSVLLLDEFEKATLAVQQLFLQILDEGRVSDARGRQYSFKHSIIIATSNAGAEYIRQHIGEAGSIPEGFETDIKNHLLSQHIFKPELLNRFDGVITFVPLTKEHIQAVARLMVQKLNERLDKQHGATITITDELLSFLAEIGYDPQFGARPMARAIQNTVEYAVAQAVLRGQVQPGKPIQLSIEYLRQVSAGQ